MLKIYREKTFSLEDLQFNVEKTLLEFTNDYRIILLDCFGSNYNNFIEYSCLISDYGIQIFKNIPNKLSVKFTKAIPQYIKINYLKIKTGSSEIFGIRENEPVVKTRIRRSASLRNFNQDLNEIKNSSDRIQNNLIELHLESLESNFSLFKNVVFDQMKVNLYPEIIEENKVIEMIENKVR